MVEVTEYRVPIEPPLAADAEAEFEAMWIDSVAPGDWIVSIEGDLSAQQGGGMEWFHRGVRIERLAPDRRTGTAVLDTAAGDIVLRWDRTSSP